MNDKRNNNQQHFDTSIPGLYSTIKMHRMPIATNIAYNQMMEVSKCC